MPNYVINVMDIIGEISEIKHLKDFVKSDASIFDFRKIIPVPDYVFQGDLPSNWEPCSKYKQNWLKWNIKNWGTKWNGMKPFEKGNKIVFQTAWSVPYPIYIALSNKFKNLIIDVRYADEDIGYNCGNFRLKAGETTVLTIVGDREKYADDLWAVFGAE